MYQDFTMGPGRWDWDGLAVCVLAFAVYINTLDHGFVYDDHRAILANPDVQPSTPIFHVFRNDFWGTPLSSSSSHGSYRPLAVLSFRLNACSGLRPFGFHLTNVILHSVATGLVLKTSRILLPGRASTLAAGLFAVHPVHVEAVAGVVGRADVLAAIFFLMSFLFYVKHVRIRESKSTLLVTNPKVKHFRKSVVKLTEDSYFTIKSSLSLNQLRTISWFKKDESFFFALYLIFAVLAVLSKEPAITVIPLAVCYDVILHIRSKRSTFLKSSTVPSASASLLTFCLVIVVRFYMMGLHTPAFSKADNPIAKESSIITRTLSFLYLPLFNSLLLVYPNSLSFDWSMDAIPRIHSIFDFRFVATILFYYLLFQTLKYSLMFSNIQKHKFSMKTKSCNTCNSLSSDTHINSCRLLNNNNLPQKCICVDSVTKRLTNKSAVTLCLVFIVLPFIPASNLFFYVGFVVAERILYIPSVGYCILVAHGANLLWSHGRKSLVILCCVLLLTGFTAKTLQRNRDWKDEESLYRSATSINPPKAYGNLGSVLGTAGRTQEAETALRLALKHRPNMADVHFNLGNLLNRQGKHEDAVKSYRDAIKYRPTLAVSYLNLGQTFETLGRWKESESVYSRCTKIDVEGLKDPRAHMEARCTCLRLLKRLCTEKSCEPETTKVISDQDVTLWSKSCQEFEGRKSGVGSTSELHLSEDTRKDVRNLQSRMKNDSITTLEEERHLQTLRKSPNDPAGYVSYGQLLVRQGRKVEAASAYLRAARLEPRHHSLVLSAAVALRHAGRLAEAEELYRQARDLRPQDATSHINLGAILHLQGKYQQAAASYSEALRLSPGDDVTLANLKKLNNLLVKNKR